MGLAEGVAYPALTVFLAAWIPERERSVLGSIVFSGGQVKECQLPKIVINPIYHFFFQVGTLLSIYVSGLILSYQSWSAVFYFWSAVSMIWFIAFV